LYRLLLIPGTAHCGGGDGTSTFDMIPMIDAWAGGQDLREANSPQTSGAPHLDFEMWESTNSHRSAQPAAEIAPSRSRPFTRAAGARPVRQILCAWLRTRLFASCGRPCGLGRNPFGHDFSGQTVNIFAARSKHVNSVMPVQNSPVRPRLKTMWLS
jgi:hypothetical protein